MDNNMNNNIDSNIDNDNDKSYSRSNVNLNVALSNPGLNINDSMSVNINYDNAEENQVSNLNSINQSLVNNTNQPLKNNDVYTDFDNEKQLINKARNEQIKINQQSIISDASDSVNYEKNFDLNVPNQSVKVDNKNSIVNFNQTNNISREEKKVKHDNDELKFVVLVSLIIFIVIMFFPNISKFFYNLFNN